MSINRFPRRFGRICEVIRCDSHNAAIFPMQLYFFPDQLARYAVIDPRNTSCRPELRAWVRAKRMEVDIVEGVTEKRKDDLVMTAC